MIYFDNSATSFYKPTQVKNAVKLALEKYCANAGRSGHQPSKEISEIVFDTREKLKNLLNCNDFNVIFTKNCSEALNLAIFGVLNPGDHVLTTVYEHNSVLRPLMKLSNDGVEVEIVEAKMLDLPLEILKRIRSNTSLVITNYVSNVTGEVCDVQTIGQICKSKNVLYLVDGAQACGHIKIDIKNSNIDALAFAGHKGLLALTGVGGLVIRNGIKLSNLIYGGTGTESQNLNQPTDFPEGYEVGTLPTISIISLNAGIEYINKNFSKITKREQKLRKYMQKRLKNLKFLKNYSKNNGLPIFSFNVKDFDSAFVADVLDVKYGICVRPGLHCAPLVHKMLGTHNSGTVRVSLDSFNTFEEIDAFISALKEIADMDPATF